MSLFYFIAKEWRVPIFIGIFFVIILIIFSVRGCGDDKFAAYKEMTKKQQAMIEEQYNTQVAGMQKTISGLNRELSESKKSNSILKLRIVDKQKKMEAIKPPEGMDEIQSRFSALGYQPVDCR